MNYLYLTTKQKTKIKKALKALEEVRKEVSQSENATDINWYLEDCGNLHLMNGATHEASGQNHSIQENIIDVFDFKESSGGGW